MIDYAFDRGCKHGDVKRYYAPDGIEYECQWCDEVIAFTPWDEMTFGEAAIARNDARRLSPDDPRRTPPGLLVERWEAAR